MEKTSLDNFDLLLTKEEMIIDNISSIQKSLRQAVQSKEWNMLTSLINKMNDETASFNEIDMARDELQNQMTSLEVKQFSKKLLVLRSKLAQSKIENRALNDYISITRGFINGVLDKASLKTYSRYGQIVQKQPVSVLVSANL